MAVRFNPRRVLLFAAMALVGAMATRPILRALPDRPRFQADAAQLERLASAAVVPAEKAANRDGWPQWRGPRRDGSAIGPAILTRWPAGGPPRLWETAGGQGYSSFAVGGGRVFTL